MITMQQLEELENRVIKALHLIEDLRTENSNSKMKMKPSGVKLKM